MSSRIHKLLVKNYLSFNTQQIIDFSKDHVSCFIGHNGSGKTNLLEAISTVINCFLNRQGKKRRLAVSFDQQKSPIALSIEFFVDEDKYCYLIESQPENKEIIKEELRDGGGKLILDLKLRSEVGELSEIEKERINTYSVNELGIFHLLFSGQVKIQDELINDAVNKAGRFFQNVLLINLQDLSVNSQYFQYEKELYENEKIKEKILNFMNKLDYGIDDIVIDKVTGDHLDADGSGRSAAESAKLLEFASLAEKMIAALQYLSPNNNPPSFYTGYRMFLRRPYLKNLIKIELESEGVERLIKLLACIYAKKDCVILVDELESGFHEALVLRLIKEVNTEVNQFIFTSHLLELMTRDCLTSRQLFSMVKENGQTVVYPVSEIENVDGNRYSLKSLYRAGKIPGYPVSEE